MPDLSWRPLLPEPLFTQANIAISRIVKGLQERQVEEFSLDAGSAGLALLYHYLSLEQPEYQALAVHHINTAIDRLNEGEPHCGLFYGLAGVSWVAQHVQRDTDDLCAEVDEALLGLLDGPWEGDFELMRGLVGLGVYFLERLPEAPALEALEKIVAHLEASAHRFPEGLAWSSDPKEEARYNLGVAHGTPGVITLLARLSAAKVAPDKTRTLLQGAISWLFSQKLSGPYSFADRLQMGAPTHPKRLVSWCYTDLGVSLSLLVAARHTQDQALEREALSMARRAARLSVEDAGVRDAGLCHGATGVGHLFHRWFCATGSPLFQRAAQRWFQYALSLLAPRQGIGGFLAWHKVSDDALGWVELEGFLMGAAGAALALLAAVSQHEPKWDRLLLLSPSGLL